MDLVFYAGPVVVTEAHRRIDWGGREVRIVPIVGSGSSSFQALAESLRGGDGRILPNLLKRYAPGVTPDKVAVASFSAGYGLVDPLLVSPADREAISAVVLSDSVFLAGDPRTGQGGPAKPGITAFGAEAVDGRKLLVSTFGHSTSGAYLNGKQSWDITWQSIRRASGCYCEPEQISPPEPVPPAQGGWWQLGSNCYWGDYAGGVTHEGHNALGAAVWQGFLARELKGNDNAAILIVALGVGLGLWAAHRRARSR